MSDMISIEEAHSIILGAIRPTVVENIDIMDTLDRVLAEDLSSDIDIAPFDNTAMDGFALRSEDIANASQSSPVSLEVISHIGAGYVFEGTLLPGQVVRIMTGAPIPKGADAVEKIEDVTWTGEGSVGDKVTFAKPSSVGKNIRKAGEDVKAGEIVIHAGETISPAAIGLLASTGHGTVPVYSKPRVGIISLGSELVPIDVKPGPGKIRNSNCYALAAEAIAAGAYATIYPTAEDDEGAITAAVKQAIDECDLVVSSGGASGGDFDYITQVADALGHVFFKYVNMRPGKSQTFAVIEDTPFFGLAGNPAAAAVGFEILVRPALLKMQGFTDIARPVTRATLAQNVKKKESRRFLLRGRIDRDEQGEFIATPAKNQSSALFSTLHQSNCLIVLPEDAQAGVAGMQVDCIRIDMKEGTVE